MNLLWQGDKALALLEKEEIPFHWPIIEQLLLIQPTSWIETNTLHGLREALEEYELKAILLGTKEGWHGLLLFSILRIEAGVLALRLEFLSCRNFYKDAQFWDTLERIAKVYGATFIEGNVHPVLAKYLEKKKGFHSPAILVRKRIDKEEMH